MKLGANSVLFGGYDMETAFKYLAMGGYDGIELSAIDGMSSHLVLENWRDLVPEIKRLVQVYGLALLAIEQPSREKPLRPQSSGIIWFMASSKAASSFATGTGD